MDQELKNDPIATLRERLVPKGDADVIKLQLQNHGYVEGALVRSAIDAAEGVIWRLLVAGSPLNDLERLGLMLLTESAGF